MIRRTLASIAVGLILGFCMLFGLGAKSNETLPEIPENRSSQTEFQLISEVSPKEIAPAPITIPKPIPVENDPSGTCVKIDGVWVCPNTSTRTVANSTGGMVEYQSYSPNTRSTSRVWRPFQRVRAKICCRR